MPAGDDRFFYGPKRLPWFHFIRSPDGAHLMEAHDEREVAPTLAARVVPARPAAAVAAPGELRSYLGTYSTEGPPVAIGMNEDGRLTLMLGDRAALPMEPVDRHEFTVQGVNARILFQEEEGEVTRFTIDYQGRQLHGQRAGR